VLKWLDERRTEDSGTKATESRRRLAVSGRVCQQRRAAERVLQRSGFELQHAGSPFEETAMDEEEERLSVGGWPACYVNQVNA